MKTKAVLALLITLLSARISFAQDTTKTNSTFYTVIFNQVPEHFKFPLIGLVNLAEGNQDGVQIGFTNVNQKNFSGTQVGFANTVGGSTQGAQVGFVNLSKDSVDGVQVGYINTSGGAVSGMQVGFINGCKDSLDGGQVGFVNLSGKSTNGAQVGFLNGTKDSVDGAQVGFVNLAGKSSNGAQVGFVNMCRDSFDGAQIGFVNVVTQELKGAQIGFVNVTPKTVHGGMVGFINVADSVTSGVPVGFLSIIKKGGYQAIEVGATELYPANVSFKIGVRQLYTTFGMAYNPDHFREFAWTAGFGSVIRISNRFFFNPEITSSQVITSNNAQHTLGAGLQFGYKFTQKWSVIAGPSVVWQQRDENDARDMYKPLFSISRNKIDTENHLVVGARLSIRYAFN